MSDIQPVGGDTGNAGFSTEWQRLAREDDQRQAPAPADGDRHENGADGKQANGQGGNAPPSEAAPRGPAPGTEDDIWADAPDRYRKAYEAEREAREKAENTVRSNNGRLSKAEREAAELRARIVAPPQQQAPQQQAPQVDPALREKLLGDYPEATSSVVDALLEMRQTVARLEASNASAAEQQAARDQLGLQEFLADQEQQLGEMHPDWGDVVREPDFVNWVNEGPQFIKDGIARNGNGIVNAVESAKILDLFKQETGRATETDSIEAKRRRQLEGSRTVPARTPGATPSGTPDDYTTVWQRLAEIDRRAAMSGATR